MKSILAALTGATAALAVVGCGDDTGTNGTAVAAGQGSASEAAADASPGNASGGTRIANRPHERMMAANDSDRRIGLVRAIRQTGNRCPRRVEPNPVYQGDYEGMALWTARCDNNEQYAVFIAPNEDVQVRNCRDMAQLRLPACRTLPAAEPTRERPKAATKG